MRGKREDRQHCLAAHVVLECAVARHDREQMFQRTVEIATRNQAVGQCESRLKIVGVRGYGCDKRVGGGRAAAASAASSSVFNAL